MDEELLNSDRSETINKSIDKKRKKI